jgi:hypothetical protein
MKIGRPHVPSSTLEPKSKKVLVRPCAADKGKGKNINISDPHTPNLSCRVFTRKALDKTKANKAEGAGGKHDHSHMSCVRQKAGQFETGTDHPDYEG